MPYKEYPTKVGIHPNAKPADPIPLVE